jgi:hypothetical protein
MRKIFVILLAMLLLLSTSPNSIFNSTADTNGIFVVATLPKKVHYSSAVWDGNKIYLFGGQNPDGLSTSIISFDPETLEIIELNVNLPKAIKRHSAVWTGSETFIIGGESYEGEPLADIIRFKPPDTVELLENILPFGVKGGSLVWSGKYVYHFGNCICPGESVKKIIRFDPLTNQTVVLDDELPGPRAGTSAVWVNGSAFIFGGRTGSGEAGQTDDIIKYTPGEGCTVMNAKFPSPRFRTSAVFHGSYVYVFGGYGPSGFLDEIVRYDPEKDQIKLLSARLPTARATRAAVFNGTYSYILGGESETKYLNEILKFDPEGRQVIEPTEPFFVYQLIGVAVLMTLLVWWVGRRKRR